MTRATSIAIVRYFVSDPIRAIRTLRLTWNPGLFAYAMREALSAAVKMLLACRICSRITGSVFGEATSFGRVAYEWESELRTCRDSFAADPFSIRKRRKVGSRVVVVRWRASIGSVRRGACGTSSRLIHGSQAFGREAAADVRGQRVALQKAMATDLGE